MIELVLGLAVMLGGISQATMPGGGDATWYGDGGRCHDGYLRTCSPYLSGEQVFYAAVGSWRWGDKPYRVNVCRVSNGRCVVVWVRDFCLACKNKHGVVDLSPAAFKKLAPLWKGRINVVVCKYGKECLSGR